MKLIGRGFLGACLTGLVTVAAAQAPQTCEQAWAEYRQFQKDNKMEPGQYALTVYGANVRALCGADALPAPPGTDTPRIIVRKPPPRPPKPPEKPASPKP